MAVAKRLTSKERAAAARVIAQRMPQAVLCEILGTSRKVISEWLSAGMRRNPDGTYNLSVVLPWLRERWTEARAPGPAEEEWITRKRRAEALMKEIDLDTRQGALVPQADVDQREVEQVQLLKRAFKLEEKRVRAEAGVDAAAVVKREHHALMTELGGGNNGHTRRTKAKRS